MNQANLRSFDFPMPFQWFITLGDFHITNVTDLAEFRQKESDFERDSRKGLRNWICETRMSSASIDQTLLNLAALAVLEKRCGDRRENWVISVLKSLMLVTSGGFDTAEPIYIQISAPAGCPTPRQTATFQTSRSRCRLLASTT
jgi:hypothetical protein